MLRIDRLKSGALPPLSFEVAGGECLAVEGPSGAGKTRLLRAIADLEPASGHVFLDGVERGEVTAAAWRKDVRFCAAEPAWWTPTVRPVLERLGLETRAGAGLTAARSNPARSGTIGARCERLLSSLGLNPLLIDRPIAALSTGERQRLALVRALVDDPKVVLLDEPTASLDAASGALVEELVKFLLLSGRSIVLVSHDGRQIERLAHARLQLSAVEPPHPLPSEARP